VFNWELHFEAPFVYGEKMKKVINAVWVTLVLILLVLGTLLAYLTVDEYKPEDREELEINGNSDKKVQTDTSMRIVAWNLGYGALGDNADFFMDGGKMVNTADKDRVYKNLDQQVQTVTALDPDFFLAQELDLNSTRSYFVNESEYFLNNSEAKVFKGINVFSYNYKVSYVPLPVPPIGKVSGGIETFTTFDVASATRIKLPCPFSWPLRTFNLKRCLQELRLPVEGSDKELVIINLHLEAYDSGEGKIAQTKLLKEVLLEEVSKGNYVIAGGDFNQEFSDVDTSMFPVLEGMWEAGEVDVTEFDDPQTQPKDLVFYTDDDTPSCRSLDKPLASAASKAPADFQYYIIDGFIVSHNIEVEQVHTEDLGFICSDHNPVVMDFKIH
jgi:endonuclease/exonuclease/phosphatase family metal-dependent hydrolase